MDHRYADYVGKKSRFLRHLLGLLRTICIENKKKLKRILIIVITRESRKECDLMKTSSLYLKTKNVPQKTIEARNVLAGGKIFTTGAKVNTAISVASNEGAACDCISFRIKKTL